MKTFSLFATVLAIGCGASTVPGGAFPADPKNLTYELGGTNVTLSDGRFVERTGDGADDHIDTDLTESRLDGDFDGDKSTDAAVVITRDEGPQKTHYLAVLFNTGSGLNTKTLPLGKGVLVTRLRVDPTGGIIVEMRVPAEGAPIGTPPAVDAIKHFRLSGQSIDAKD